MEQNFDDYLNSDEFIADSKAAQLAMEAHDKLELTRFNRIMKKLKKRLSACWFEQLKSYIEDSGFTFNFEIVNKPIGDKENQELRFKVFVDQSCGISGDDYYGTVCIPIKNGQYLKYDYSM